MKSILSIFTCLLMFVFASSAAASSVVQGKCLEYNKTTNIIRVEEFDTNFSKEFKYGRPTGIESQFDTSKAEIGVVPESGDIVRLAVEVVGDSKLALKIMNVSKQDLMKK